MQTRSCLRKQPFRPVVSKIISDALRMTSPPSISPVSRDVMSLRSYIIEPLNRPDTREPRILYIPAWEREAVLLRQSSHQASRSPSGGAAMMNPCPKVK